MIVENALIIGPAVLVVFLIAWSALRHKSKVYTDLIFVGCILFSASIMALSWWPEKQGLITLFGGSNVTTVVAFSPKQGASNLVIQTIKGANKYVYVAAYYFTYQPIADALGEAHDKGIDVKIVLDKTQKNALGNLLAYFKDKGISTRINSKYAIMHNKFMIIDGVTLQIGSFNYTERAENKNAENVLVIRNDLELVTAYLNQWQKLWLESSDLK